MMRAYELMVIIDGDVDDPKAQSYVKAVTDAIAAAGGSIHGKPDWWGKRQFAYPINRKETGYYLVVEAIAPAGSLERARAHPPHRGRGRPPQADQAARRRGRAPRHDGRRRLRRRPNHEEETDMADNTVTLVGNVTRDPELRYTSGGRGVASFGLAVNRRYQSNGEWQEQTSFFDVVAWGTLGENAAASLHKGTRVVVYGRLEQRSWETEDGEKRTDVEVIADEIGPSLRWAQAQVEKTARTTGEAGQQQGRRPRRPLRPRPPTPSYGDEEPF